MPVAASEVTVGSGEKPGVRSMPLTTGVAGGNTGRIPVYTGMVPCTVSVVRSVRGVGSATALAFA